jgi:hypothetical protein
LRLALHLEVCDAVITQRSVGNCAVDKWINAQRAKSASAGSFHMARGRATIPRMSDEVFLPHLPKWFLVLAGAVWIVLTMVSVLLSEEDGFAFGLAERLSATAATVAFAVTGLGGGLRHWQTIRKRERTVPLIQAQIGQATNACARIVAAYGLAGSPNLPGATKLDYRTASSLLEAPVLGDKRDLSFLELWGDYAEARLTRSTGLFTSNFPSPPN